MFQLPDEFYFLNDDLSHRPMFCDRSGIRAGAQSGLWAAVSSSSKNSAIRSFDRALAGEKMLPHDLHLAGLTDYPSGCSTETVLLSSIMPTPPKKTIVDIMRAWMFFNRPWSKSSLRLFDIVTGRIQRRGIAYIFIAQTYYTNSNQVLSFKQEYS